MAMIILALSNFKAPIVYFLSKRKFCDADSADHLPHNFVRRKFRSTYRLRRSSFQLSGAARKLCGTDKARIFSSTRLVKAQNALLASMCTDR